MSSNGDLAFRILSIRVRKIASYEAVCEPKPRFPRSDDLVIGRLAKEDEATIFATDDRDGPPPDLLSVHETSQEPLPEGKDDINSAHSLGVEAAFINQSFLLSRYRRWKLDDNNMYLVARCELQSTVELDNHKCFLSLSALNEFDPKYSGVDWKQKLETQRGAAEGFRWQIYLNTSNMWGIVKSIVDLCMKLSEGKYALVKDPSKPEVRIYEVPADAFENDYVEEPLPDDEQVQPPEENNNAEAGAGAGAVSNGASSNNEAGEDKKREGQA
ncbi:unnamed protein product [Brassica oleracea var. botrytis]|uniref:Uncharacterized protein n=2 Tax=Brassica TaxID=3705 RepID=A0A0D3AU28_BRAOL|nr:hypothetical protein HID58_048539 [Brassica napus]CAF1919013.1 unnamed protein product [Brassica napus]